MGSSEPGIKARVARALEESKGVALTMGEIIAKADINKTQAMEVSSALYKLRNQGLVQTVRGPSSSSKGPKFVRRYLWSVKVAVRVEKVVVSNPMAGLGVFRI